ncbi:MAG: hypothetical protein SFW36_06785 [Leptolyngbyaceae cyanobacterium bins.59]|nr:hypothetical protein [Leptolyngbyaceae cyanobacterium bins.59]
MNNDSTNNNQPLDTQAEIQADAKGVHVEFTIPWKQVQRLGRPVGLTLTHLVTAGLTALSMNHSLLQPVPPVPAPTINIPAQAPTLIN